MPKQGIVVDPKNTFSGSLAAGENFTGTGEDVRAFSEITVNLYGEPAVAPATLYFEFSPDGSNWDVSVPYSLAGPQSFVPLPLRVVLPYFRVRYVNGATPLTALRITTVYHWESSKHLTRVINQTIDENEPVENVRAFIGAKSPNGPFVNTPANGIVSDLSTTTPLAIDGVFDSEIVSTEGWNTISVVAKSDVNSANNGIKFQFYADALGTRLLIERQFTYGASPDGAFFQIPCNPQGPYVKITYTNGSTAQATFELQTFLIVQAPPPDAIAISDTITGNNSAQIVKANVVGLQENGIYANVGLSNSASSKVAIADRPSEVRNRTSIVIDVPVTALDPAGSTIYTVTGGKTLYIHSFVLTSLNSAATDGSFVIRDNTTRKGTFLLPQRVSGSVPSAASATSPTLPEPLSFSTNVNLQELTGTIEASGFFLGYEE